MKIRKTRLIVGAALVAFAAGSARAQTPAATPLPTVKQVFDAYAKAVGGREQWEKVTDRADSGKAEIVFAGLTGSYVRYYAAPNKMRLTIDLGGGKVEQGTDGFVVWSGQPDGTMTKMAEPDATYLLEANTTGAAFLDPSLFSKASVETKEDFDGVPCYKVPITTKAGRERIDFFEVATGLRRGQVVMTLAGLQRTVWRDYKVFDRKLLPTTHILTNPQGDIIITVASVRFTPNDPVLFALPPGIAKPPTN